MPKQPRKRSSAGFYHFVTRGINKKALFHKDRDFGLFQGLLLEYRDKFEISIYHYCFMTNHIHLAVSAELRNLSKFAHALHRGYARFYIEKYSWPGQVFQRSFYSSPIENGGYLLECGRYIERNPLKAGIVKRVQDYAYSSYSFYALGNENPLVTPSPLYQDLGNSAQAKTSAYQFYVNQERPQDRENSTRPFLALLN